MKPNVRLTGLDLFRGLAVYAVILLHLDEGFTTLPWGFDAIIQFVGFAVPFFLATSFYLSVSKIRTSPHQPFALKARINRLLIPYLVWTILYLVYKMAKYGLEGDFTQIDRILSHPVAILLFGGAAIHLYFLPLLIIGTVVTKLMESVLKRQAQRLTLVFCVLSLGVYEWVLRTGNDFAGPDHAFESLLTTLAPGLYSNQIIRSLAVISVWVIRCLAYIWVAALLSQQAQLKDRLLNSRPWQSALLILGFVGVNAVGHLYLPMAIHELLRGYLGMMTAIALSHYVPKARWWLDLGVNSFGIYLVHLLVLEGLQLAVARLLYDNYRVQVTTPVLLLMATATFFVSWGLTAMIARVKPISKLAYGD
jgi:peptidoglycan/LPS O-acetylase OafA/YrhL